MDEANYEYYGLMVQTWDLLRGDASTWPDHAFYREVIDRYGTPALDVGCGTGRLLLDYLADGYDIDGADNSPEMLMICREKAGKRGLQPRLYQQAMQSLVLPRTYRTIIVPSSSFQLLTDMRLARQAMDRFCTYTAPGGVLAMPFMVLWQEGHSLEADWKLIAEAQRPEDGALVRHWSRANYEPDQQLQHTEDRYEILRDGELIASEYHQRFPGTRWYTQAQAVKLYEQAGFDDIQVCKGFTFEPAAPDDTTFTVLGVKTERSEDTL